MRNLMTVVAMAVIFSVSGFSHNPEYSHYYHHSKEMHGIRVEPASEGNIQEIRGKICNSERVAGDITAKISFRLDQQKGDSPFAVYVVPVGSDDKEEVRRFYVESGQSEMDLNLPAGRYDLAVVGSREDYKECVLLCYEDLEISEGFEKHVSFDEAEISTNLVLTGSDGTVIDDYNLVRCDLYLIIDWKNKFGELAFILVGGADNWTMGKVLRTNCISDSWKFTLLGEYLWTGATTCVVLPVDFSLPKQTPSSSNWFKKDVGFCKTPLNIRKDEIFEKDDPDYYAYSYLRTLLIDGEWIMTDGGNGARPDGALRHNENFYEFWEPEGYDGLSKIKIFPSGSNVVLHVGASPDIQGMPIGLTADGLRQTGVHPESGCTGYYSFTDKGVKDYSGNPYLNVAPPYGTLGNCAPTLITVPNAASFDFDFKGRYGENLTIDATSYYSPSYEWDNELREQLGLPVCDVSVKANGKEICNSIDSFLDVRKGSGVIDGKISTDNVIVDGTIPGFSTAEFHYDSSKGNGSSPTLTLLQFRNSEGDVTDRFSRPEEGAVTVYAMAPIEKLDFTDGFKLWFETGKISKIKMEWSPNGKNEWKEMAVKENPEYFYMPGWGHFFSGSLAGVDKKCDNGWYDLRIYIEDEFGAWQRQTVSPAFRIGSPSVVDQVSNEEENVRVIGGSIVAPVTAKVYNVSGRETGRSNLDAGIYFVVIRGRTGKVVVGRR